MGMGGAGVAITTDALATYWNPAGLAMTQTVDIRIVGGVQAIDRLGVADAVTDLENFNPNDPNTAANIAKAQDIANRINRPGANTSFNGARGKCHGCASALINRPKNSSSLERHFVPSTMSPKTSGS